MMYYGVALVSRIDQLYVSFAKEPYRRDNILQKRPVILSILLSVATQYPHKVNGILLHLSMCTCVCIHIYWCVCVSVCVVSLWHTIAFDTVSLRVCMCKCVCIHIYWCVSVSVCVVSLWHTIAFDIVSLRVCVNVCVFIYIGVYVCLCV